MELAVGSKFYYEGTALEVVNSNLSCDNCYFHNDKKCNHEYKCSSSDREDGTNVIFKEIEGECNRSINISLNDAKRLYELGGRMKELALSAYNEYDLNPKMFPSSWDEFINSLDYDSSEELIDKISTIDKTIGSRYSLLFKLITLRDLYNNGWKPDYSTGDIKYSIKLFDGKTTTISTIKISHLLTFGNITICNKFIENFNDMIIKVGDLI